jgi:radical SAM superfamily enzyme with C-terminal helix-hairpin-helix motif
MYMARIVSVLLIGIGGYFLFQRRYRFINIILGNTVIRRLFIRTIMNFPGIKNRMMSSIFPQSPNPA